MWVYTQETGDASTEKREIVELEHPVAISVGKYPDDKWVISRKVTVGVVKDPNGSRQYGYSTDVLGVYSTEAAARLSLDLLAKVLQAVDMSTSNLTQLHR
jgi:hypothetical protein